MLQRKAEKDRDGKRQGVLKAISIASPGLRNKERTKMKSPFLPFHWIGSEYVFVL